MLLLLLLLLLSELFLLLYLFCIHQFHFLFLTFFYCFPPFFHFFFFSYFIFHFFPHFLLFPTYKQYTEKYPQEPPIIELTSPSLPAPLLRLKEKECHEKAKEFLGKSQIKIIYEIIYNFIQINLFIPCWREMKLGRERKRIK